MGIWLCAITLHRIPSLASESWAGPACLPLTEPETDTGDLCHVTQSGQVSQHGTQMPPPTPDTCTQGRVLTVYVDTVVTQTHGALLGIAFQGQLGR